MTIFWQLLEYSLVPVVLSVAFYLAEKRTKFESLPYMTRQIIIGAAFGAAACFATEFGVDVGGATANARDAAPLCAGLMFGAPSGIIAGLIGGIHRYIAVLWGAGMYTRVACSVSTAIAGFYAAFLRKKMFDDKRPTWGFGVAIAVIMEVIHMTLVFLTNMSDPTKAFDVVKICTVPMVICNGASLLLSSFFISLIGHKKRGTGTYKKISQQIQVWLLITVVCAYLFTTAFVFALQSFMATTNSDNLMKLNMEDVAGDIQTKSDSNILSLTKKVASEIDSGNKNIQSLASKYEISEINIVNGEGIITESTNPSFRGFDMKSGEQSDEFNILLTGGQKSWVQEYQPISYDASISRKYAAYVLSGEGYVQVGYDAKKFQKDIQSQVSRITEYRHVGNTGYIIIANESGSIISDLHGHYQPTLDSTGIDLTGTEPYKRFETEIYGEKCYCIYDESEGYKIIAVMPESEVYDSRDKITYVNTFMEVLVFAFLFGMIYFLIKALVVKNIWNINSSLSKIINGDLDTTVDVRSSDEFSSLSDDINSTVSTLKHYIDEAAARIDKELAFAKSIQHDSLPNVFPAFPGVKQFDIYATMDTAKEVGGDFYDFYMPDESHLAFLIADVSGKGIPAAMFMMRAKTMIKNFASAGFPVNEVFTKANYELCQGNDAGMFVTGWMGVLDINTGHVDFANAGHNPPVLYRKGEGFSYLKSKVGFVLAGMDSVKYKAQEITLNPGDRIYLYTDGVTEATSIEKELYGEDRLLSFLNSHHDDDAEHVLKGVKGDIDLFVGEAEQFDDITMVMVDYKG